MDEQLVCGIDSSTQSTKVELRDAGSGELVATGLGAHPATSPPPANRTRGHGGRLSARR